MHLTSKQLFNLAFSLAGILLLVGTIIFFNLNEPAIHNELITLYLIPQPERLTELYFNNNASLPSSMTDSQEINFEFVIHNLETADYRYAYVVSVNVHGTKHIVDSRNVLVKNGQYYVKAEKFKFKDKADTQEIVVELLNKQQSIDFWMRK